MTIKVEKADRLASWPTMRWLYEDDPAHWAVAEKQHMEGDNDEHFIVQDFAKARHQAYEEAATIADGFDDQADDNPYSEAARVIAKAIRARPLTQAPADDGGERS